MAGNTLTLEFAGDASKLQRAAKQSTAATDDIVKAAKGVGEGFEKSAKQSDDFATKIGKLGAGMSGATDAVDQVGQATQALADIQSAGARQAEKTARANQDVAQAQEDLNQALRDGKQATIDGTQAEVDLEQARLDQATALDDYNQAVREHGSASLEAKQAMIDMKQAGVDVKQAQEDSAQATRDAAQANIDSKGAQLDLNAAMKEAHPPELQKWADKINMVTPLLGGLMSVMGLVTMAQWAWNAAQLASPLTWIVLAIVAVIAVIVLLVKNWDWVKKAGAAAWRGIVSAASSAWNWIKKIPGWIGGAFKNIANVISRPFRSAFNFISDAWNNTIGRLSWSVPGWVPGIGGASISVPNLPHFHSGGVVPGAPGTEMAAILQAGETVTPAGKNRFVLEIRAGGSQMDDLFVEVLSRAVRRRGGDVQRALGGMNA